MQKDDKTALNCLQNEGEFEFFRWTDGKCYGLGRASVAYFETLKQLAGREAWMRSIGRINNLISFSALTSSRPSHLQSPPHDEGDGGNDIRRDEAA